MPYLSKRRIRLIIKYSISILLLLLLLILLGFLSFGFELGLFFLGEEVLEASVLVEKGSGG